MCRRGDGCSGESTGCSLHPATKRVSDRGETRRFVLFIIHMPRIDVGLSIHAGERWLVAIMHHCTLAKVRDLVTREGTEE